MGLDTNKTIESVTYNGTAFKLKGGGTTASEVDYTNATMEGVANVKDALDTLGADCEKLGRTAHIHKNKQLLDWLYLEGETLKYHYTAADSGLYHELQVAPKLYNGDSDSFIIEDNEIVAFNGDVASLTITFPSTATNTYMSTLSFKSGTTATSFTYPNNIIWSGFDITNGQFVPAAGKYYEIVFWKNSYGFNAVVRGVWT